MKTSHDMTVRHLLSIAIVVIAAGASLSADRVRLRSGKVVEGMFIGADSKTVRVLLDSGSVSEIRIEDAVAVEFSARKPTPSPTPYTDAITEPGRGAEARDSARGHGTECSTHTGDRRRRLTGGTDVQGDRGRSRDDRRLGRDSAWRLGSGAGRPGAAVGQDEGQRQDLAEDQLHRVWRESDEVVTGYVEAKGSGEGKRTARKVGGGAGLGAIVGGIAGGGQGAAIGAAVGGVTGAAVSSGGEEHLKLAAETRLQFQLTAAVNIQR